MDARADDSQFDAALIGAALAQVEALGWHRVQIAEAARQAGLPLDRVRARFPHPVWVLLRLGTLADQAALADQGSTGSVREQLFDMLMRRFDVLQTHRGGVRRVLRTLPFDPPLALLLAAETRNSIAWIAQAAGLDTGGIKGALRVTGLVGVWLQAMRAWERDTSLDLSGTMAALDRALDRAASLGRFLGESAAGAPADPPLAEPPLPESAARPEQDAGTADEPPTLEG